MNLKKITLLVVLMGVLFTTTFANNKKRHPSQDRMSYFKEKVKPIVDSQRAKLEPSISNSDKQEISRLREEIFSQKLMEHAFISEVQSAKFKGEEVTDGDWLEIRVQQIMIDNLLDEAKVIADKYQPKMEGLLVSVNADLSSLQRGTVQGHHQTREENPVKSMDSVRFLLWDVNQGF